MIDAGRLIGGGGRQEPDLGVKAGPLLGIQIHADEVGLAGRDIGAIQRGQAAVHVGVRRGQQLLDALVLAVDDLAEEGVGLGLDVRGHLRPELGEGAGVALDLAVVGQLEHLLVQVGQRGLAPLRIEQPAGVVDDVLAAQLVGAGGGQQRLVGHRVHDAVRQAGGDLVRRQVHPTVDHRGPELGPVEEVRRLQHRLDHQLHAVGKGIGTADQLRPLGEMLLVLGHLGVDQRPPVGAQAEVADEGLGVLGTVVQERPVHARVAAGGGQLGGGLLVVLPERRRHIQHAAVVVERAADRLAEEVPRQILRARALEQVDDRVLPLPVAQPHEAAGYDRERWRSCPWWERFHRAPAE